jgi:leucyl/phenylalanyl-tRNA--protein transferase
MPVYQLTDKLIFPPADLAEEGILAVGGDLSPERLTLAYQMGIFPWYNVGDPITWWCPEKRFVLFPGELKVSQSMKQVLRSDQFRITSDNAFDQVIEHCRVVKRPKQDGTWITDDMQEAYNRLHEVGMAHSVEVWQGEKLVGGLYGVLVGGCFCGESMFSDVSNASKAGLITMIQSLVPKGLSLIDCQVYTDHLASLGAKAISRSAYLEKLEAAKKQTFEFVL